MRKPLLVLVLLAWLAGSPASAVSLSVSPVLLEVTAPSAATTVTLRNKGLQPIMAQVRVFRWSQEGGSEQLEPTEDVAASPPAAELFPGQDYAVRAVRLTKTPWKARRPIASSSTNCPVPRCASARCVSWCAT